MTWSLSGRHLSSVLVTRLRYLGDIAMTTVVLEVLRRGDPELRIGYLCESEYAPLLQEHPHLERLHSLRSRRRGSDARARQQSTDPTAGAHSTWRLIHQLRRANYDLSLDLFFNPRSAWLLRLAGSRWRIGGSRSWRKRLYTHTVSPPQALIRPRFIELAPGGLGDHLGRLAPLRHEESGMPFLDWCEEVFAPQELRPCVPAPALGAGAAQSGLARLGIDPARGFILLSPGATWPTKEWPLDHWRGLISRLHAMTDLPVVVLRPPGTGDPYGSLSGLFSPRAGGVLPQLDLPEALRAVAACSLLVTVDGGVMHAGIAMGRPTLALFGPTAPDIWFPYAGRGPFRVLADQPHCHPCHRHTCEEFICLPALSPRMVAASGVEMLDQAGDSDG